LSETRGSHTRTYLYEPDSFAPLAQLEHQQNKRPLAMGEGWVEETALHLAPSTAQNATQNTAPLLQPDEALDNPRQAAVAFQAMMLAKTRQIRGGIALAQAQAQAQAQHHAANDSNDTNADPDRTRPMQGVPGHTLKRALETNATNATNAISATNARNDETNSTPARPKHYRVSYLHNDHLGTPRELWGSKAKSNGRLYTKPGVIR
jgi:hypothetical protein